MARLLCIDYGLKRCGIAVSDAQQIIATALTVVSADDLLSFLREYFQKEPVEKVIIGLPMKLNNTPTDMTSYVQEFIMVFKNQFPTIPLVTWDERFTSRIAQRALLESGQSKKTRRQKESVDKVASVMMLQEFMQANARH